MKNRLTRYNNGFIGNDNSINQITDGVVSLNKKNSTITENYYISDPNLISYNPPSEWRSLPSFSGVTQGFAGVFAVYDNDTNFVTLQMDTSTGNYTVDWGDGTTGSFADNAIAYKRYTPSTYSGLTSSIYKNYKTLVIQAYPVSGTLNGIVLTNAHNQSGFQASYQYPWLNVQIVGSSCSNVSVTNLWNIEQINFIGRNSITNNQNRFNGCRGLKKVVNWDTSTCTNFGQMFRSCHNLLEAPRLNTSAATSTDFSYMFENCFSLRYVPWFDLSKATTIDSIFAYCFSLATIPAFDTGNVTDIRAAFQACQSIEEFPWFNFSKVTNFGNALIGCTKLKKFPSWNFSSATNISYGFGTLYNVIEIGEMNTANVTNMTQTFVRLNSLKKLPKTLNVNKVGSLSGAFYEAFALENLPTFIRDGNTVLQMDAICYSCNNLKTIPNFNTNRISRWDTAFLNNYGLETVGFTFNYPAGQTWATSVVFNSTFQNCQNLKRIEISDVSGISGTTYTTAYSGMFSSCVSLNYVGLSGISENFSIQNCSLGSTALNELYDRLAVVGASGAGAKTITVSGNWGAANDNPSIAIAKGWSVSG